MGPHKCKAPSSYEQTGNNSLSHTLSQNMEKIKTFCIVSTSEITSGELG